MWLYDINELDVIESKHSFDNYSLFWMMMDGYVKADILGDMVVHIHFTMIVT